MNLNTHTNKLRKQIGIYRELFILTGTMEKPYSTSYTVDGNYYNNQVEIKQTR